MPRGSPWKMVGLALGVFGVGVAGVVVGSLLRGVTLNRSDAYIASDPVATSLLKRGMLFPDAEIAGWEGSTRTTQALGTTGTVFLFLDLECPPCVDMARRWQAVVDGGGIPGLSLVGVTYQPSDVADSFREEHGIEFPIVEDTGHVFLTEWRVQRFPLEVVVGSDGRVRSLSYDSATPVDLDALAVRLGG